jgi:hypothetical protein
MAGDGASFAGVSNLQVSALASKEQRAGRTGATSLQLAHTETHLAASFCGDQVAGGLLAGQLERSCVQEGARAHCLDGGAMRWAGQSTDTGGQLAITQTCSAISTVL